MGPREAEARFEEVCRGYGREPACIGPTLAPRILGISVGGEELLGVSIEAMGHAWVNGLARILR